MVDIKAIAHRSVSVWDGRINLNVKVKGDGPPLVYFHPAAGLSWDPFLDRLAAEYTIYAPEFPGTAVGDPYAISHVENVHEAVLIFEEAIRKLGLVDVPAIGQSFGGMMALELAAAYPALFSMLVVLDPIGLWRDEAPVASWMEATPDQLVRLLFKDPGCAAARAALALPDDPDAAIKAQAQLVWNLGATGKIVWPIPDLGLDRRLHRVACETLIVWGEDDALISSSYARLLGDAISHSRVEIVPDCGHIPQIEQIDATFDLVSRFLERASPPARGSYDGSNLRTAPPPR